MIDFMLSYRRAFARRFFCANYLNSRAVFCNIFARKKILFFEIFSILYLLAKKCRRHRMQGGKKSSKKNKRLVKANLQYRICRQECRRGKEIHDCKKNMQKNNLKRELGFPDDNIARRLKPVMMSMARHIGFAICRQKCLKAKPKSMQKKTLKTFRKKRYTF